MIRPPRLLLALWLACLLPWGASATSQDPGPGPRLHFQPEQPFGATGVAEVALLATMDWYWEPAQQEQIRTAFLQHLFVTGPDGAPVEYGVEVGDAAGMGPDESLGHNERLLLTGLPDGWNTVWIFKRDGLQASDLVGVSRPRQGEAPRAWWLETERYWRLDYLVGLSDPGLVSLSQQLEQNSWSTLTYAQVAWSEPVDLAREGLTDSVTFLDADGAPLACHPGQQESTNAALFWVWCEGGPVAGVQLLEAPAGLESGVSASFPTPGETEVLDDWAQHGEVSFAVRRTLEAPAVELADPELPERTDVSDGPFEEPFGVGCSAAPGAGTGVGLGLLVLALVARRRRVAGAA